MVECFFLMTWFTNQGQEHINKALNHPFCFIYAAKLDLNSYVQPPSMSFIRVHIFILCTYKPQENVKNQNDNIEHGGICWTIQHKGKISRINLPKLIGEVNKEIASSSLASSRSSEAKVNRASMLSSSVCKAELKLYSDI